MPAQFPYADGGRLNAAGREAMAAYLVRYPRPALIIRLMCLRTWQVMRLDGYFREGVEGHDADSAAALGIAKALPKFDPAKSKLATFLPYGIRSAVQAHYGRPRNDRAAAAALSRAGLGWAELPHELPSGGRPFQCAVDDADEVEATLAALPRVDAEKLIRHFGLGGRRPETVREITRGEGQTASAFGGLVTRSGVKARTLANTRGLR
jgi:hypothetical protein